MTDTMDEAVKMERPTSEGFRTYIDYYMMSFARERFATGEFPHMQRKVFGNALESPENVLGGVLRRGTESGGWTRRVFEGPDWVVLTEFSAHSLNVEMYTADPELFEPVMKALQHDAGVYETPTDDSVRMGFWCNTGNGPVKTSRRIEVQPWSEVEQNYSAQSSAALRKLVGVVPTLDSGRLVLFHGPPGTGKTTMIRTLAKEWSNWCSVEPIMDPEQLFGSAAYLTSVMLKEGTSKDWRLLVLEDCDELLRGAGTAHTGQALARLLNLSDGLLGQGQKLLVVLTTNEPIGKLHPAVIRPGRCLAEVEVGPLSAEEASDWLGETVREPMTLAELYARKNNSDTTRALIETGPVQSGQYL